MGGAVGRKRWGVRSWARVGPLHGISRRTVAVCSCFAIRHELVLSVAVGDGNKTRIAAAAGEAAWWQGSGPVRAPRLGEAG